MKLFSVVLATLIWFTVKANLSKEYGDWRGELGREFDRQPVLVMGTPREHGNFSIEPNFVKVSVRGAATVIEQLRPSEIHAFVRLPSESSISALVQVEIHVPRGITITRVEPHVVLCKAN